VYPNTIDSHVSFQYSESNRNAQFGTVYVNETDSYSHSSYWRFTLSVSTPSNHKLSFNIRIKDNSGYDKIFYADLDFDDDGLTDNEELYLYFTDPNDSDSDDDGLTDGEEVNTFSTDPNDSDSDDDNLTDSEEINNYFTDPNDFDSDNDGLTDGEEVNTYSTDPNDADTDNDNLPDGWEVSNNLNPIINDSGNDPDNDDLSNLNEYLNNTNPNDSDSDDDNLTDGEEINIYLTDPNDTDSDDDGLTDGEEVVIYSTNPNLEDTDGDKLSDSDEVNIYQTSPLSRDTDGDGYNDYEEIFTFRTDPNSAFSSITVTIVIIIIISVLISLTGIIAVKKRSTILKEKYLTKLEDLLKNVYAQNLAKMDSKLIKIEGDTKLDKTNIQSFIKKGFPVILEDGQIYMWSIYGLSLFLKSFAYHYVKNPSLSQNLTKLLKYFNDYIDNSKKILKFIHNEGRVPEKDEVWELEISIDDLELLSDLISFKVECDVLANLNITEINYYNELSKPIILSDDLTDIFKLENLAVNYSLNLIDAKILPEFVNSLLTAENLDAMIERFINLSNLPKEQLDKINKLATKIIKLNLTQDKFLNLLDLTRELKIGLKDAAEALYFLNNSEKLVTKEFTEKEIEELSKILTNALEYCSSNEEELSTILLITEFNLDLNTANELLKIYRKEFELPEVFSRKEISDLDQISHSIIKYMKEVNEAPTIDDLMLNLNLNVQYANNIVPFINKIMLEPVHETFENLPEKLILRIDDLSTEILKLKDQKGEQNLLDLAYKLNSGIYSVKRALEYLTWIEEKVTTEYINNLPKENKNQIEIENKLKAALKHIKENNMELSVNSLLEEVGFNLRDTYTIIGLYNIIISTKVEIGKYSESKKNKIEALAREIYRQKKRGIIETYEPEKVFTLEINGANLEEFWEALNYLKVKILDELMTKSEIIKPVIGDFGSKGPIQFKERHGIKIGKKESIKLYSKTIKLEETKFAFKKVAEKVELKRGIDFIGGLIRYKVVISNKSKMVITNLDLSLQMTAEHIRIIDVKPKIYKKFDRAIIPNMSPRQSMSIDFLLEPMICGTIPVIPLITYLDAYSKPQILSGDSLDVISKCPLIMNPGEENIAKLKKIYENNNIIKSKRTFELEHNPRESFDLLQEAIGKWAGKQVFKPIYEQTEPFIAEAYYYNLNQIVDPVLGQQEQIIIKIRVDGIKNVAILSVGAEKNETVNGVLTNIWQLANEKYKDVFSEKLKSLHCPFCGSSVECLELEQEQVLCSNCGEKCLKNELTKF